MKEDAATKAAPDAGLKLADMAPLVSQDAIDDVKAQHQRTRADVGVLRRTAAPSAAQIGENGRRPWRHDRRQALVREPASHLLLQTDVQRDSDWRWLGSMRSRGPRFQEKQVQDAIFKFRSALDVAGQRDADNRTNVAQKVVLKAQWTKATAVMLMKMQSKIEPKSRRPHVQAEMQELRKAGGHLARAVQSALSMTATDID